MKLENQIDILNYIKEYCKKKNYGLEEKRVKNGIRLEIGNLYLKTIIIIYETGTISVQGKDTKLKNEFLELKEKIVHETSTNQEIDSLEIVEIRPGIMKYNIVNLNKRKLIKKKLETSFESNIKFDKRIEVYKTYQANIKRNGLSATIIQYKNGTLTIQGKTDQLFEGCCEIIEKSADPTEKEVATRFISSDKSLLDKFNGKFSPVLQENSLEHVKNILSKSFNYLNDYDQTYLVVSKILSNAEIELPEYSAYIMPAAKGYEGYVKKMVIDLNIVDKDYFEKKNNSSIPGFDKTNPILKSLSSKDKDFETQYKYIIEILHNYRHFSMHSDNSGYKKIETLDEANNQLNVIYTSIEKSFKYFNEIFNIG